MPDADRNVELIRDLYERYTMGDGPEGILDSLADDVLWRSVGPPNRLPFARSCQGRDGVRAYFRALSQDWEMISYKVNELIGQRDRVVVLADACFCHRRDRQARGDAPRPTCSACATARSSSSASSSIPRRRSRPRPTPATRPGPNPRLSGDADL